MKNMHDQPTAMAFVKIHKRVLYSEPSAKTQNNNEVKKMQLAYFKAIYLQL